MRHPRSTSLTTNIQDWQPHSQTKALKLSAMTLIFMAPALLLAQPARLSVSSSVSNPPAPVADAGPNQTVPVGGTAHLDGSASTDPSRNGQLTYQWQFTARPPASNAAVSNAGTVMPSFVVDAAGTYVVELTVNNGAAANSSSVIISTTNSPPVARAGANQTVAVGSHVHLDGSASSDVDGNRLSYSWTLIQEPSGSTATLAGADGIAAQFVADQPGTYVAQLIVSDGITPSQPATVTISTVNTPPTANAGPWQTANVGASVQLNGSQSTDVDGNAITYGWGLLSVPSGSAATLSDPTVATPTLTVDLPGTYVVQLIVNDGKADSTPAVVVIDTTSIPPVANGGLGQLVTVGGLVQLNAAGSTDLNGNLLKVRWSIISAPAFSGAALSDPTAVNPTFTADLPGVYVAQVIVNDGTFDSAPATVAISTSALLPPVASAGLDQSITAGSTVALSGTAVDPQNLALGYQWAMISQPSGSTATLSNPTGSSPTFVPDQPGTYIAQLIVNNGQISSLPSTVTLTTGATVPVAAPGSGQNIATGASAKLDGSGSFDADQNSLTYSWALISRPSASSATLADSNTPAPTLLPDIAGTYLAQLTVSDGQIVSKPVTVLITATSSNTIQLAPNPLSIGSNGTATITVLLPAPAGSGGQVVSLVTSDSNMASVTSSVAVPQNATGANTPVTAGSTTGTATLTASAPGFSPATATLTVSAPSIAIKLDTPSLGIEQTINGLIVLNTPAPNGGLPVILLFKPTDVIDVVAPNLMIPAGSLSAPFTVTGLALGSAKIVASAPGYADGSASVSVATIPAIKLAANLRVAPGESAIFPMELTTPAPAGGVTITLASGDASILNISPSTIVFAEGSKTPATQPQVSGVGFGSATVLATAAGYVSGSATVQVTINAAFSSQNLTITGPQTQSLTLYLTSPAPSQGLTLNLTSSNSKVASVPATVTFAGGATSATVLVQGVDVGSTVVHASSLPVIADTTVAVTIMSAGVIGVPSTLTVGLGQSAPFPISLPAVAPSNGVVVTLTSSDPTTASVPSGSITISGGQKTPLTPPQVNGVNFGSATLTVSAPGYTTGTLAVKVADTLSFFPATLTITGIATQNLTLNLSAPAPPGGLTINLSSSDATVASVPATVAFAASATSAAVPVTSVGIGTATIHANALPNIPDATASVTVASPGNILLPSNITVGPGQSLAFPVTLSAPAPTGGVTIALATSDSSKVTISPNAVTIPAGAVAPAAQPRVTGVGIGSATITASAPGYATVKQAVAVGLSITFSPATLSIVGTSTQSFTLTLSAPAPTGGLTITLSSSDITVATVPPTVVFAANATTANVPVTGVAPGAATIHASDPPLISDTTASVTVSAVAPVGAIAISPLSLGLNLEAPLTITLPQAVAVATQLTLTSGDPTKLLLSSSAGTQGTGSLSVSIPAGGTSASGIYAQALVGTGAVTLTASASGFTSGTATVLLTPSGFVLQGPKGVGASFSATQGASTTITVLPARLDSSLNFAEGQQLRPGVSASVTVTSSSTTVGTISTSPLTFNPGDQGATTQFTAVNSGATTLTAAPPTGFSLPAQGANALVATVTPAGLVAVNATVGKGLETTANILLNGVAPSSGLQVSVTSNNPSQLLLSTNPSGAGSASIVLTIPAGSNSSQSFYLYGAGNSGTATYSASAPGFGTGTGTVTVAPSGFFIAGPSGPGSPSLFTTTGAAPTTISVMSAALDSSLNIVALQPVAGGTSVTVSVTSSNNSVGTITSPSVTIASGASSATTQFRPAAAGSTTLSAVAPAGFSTPQNGSVVATVLTPGLALTTGISIGNGLQESGLLLLGQAAPPQGVSVTLTSNNPSQLLLSTSATGKGSSSITLTVPSGSTSAPYFIQAFGSIGNVTYSATSPGFATRTATITLAPSGAVVFGPFGISALSVAVGSGPTAFSVSMAQLNTDNSFAFVEQLAGGTSVTLNLTSSSSAVGSIGSPVTIPGGSDTATTNFTPLSPGSTTVSVQKPAGFTQATTGSSVAVTVH